MKTAVYWPRTEAWPALAHGPRRKQRPHTLRVDCWPPGWETARFCCSSPGHCGPLLPQLDLGNKLAQMSPPNPQLILLTRIIFLSHACRRKRNHIVPTVLPLADTPLSASWTGRVPRLPPWAGTGVIASSLWVRTLRELAQRQRWGTRPSVALVSVALTTRQARPS